MVSINSMIACVNGNMRGDTVQEHDLVYCYDAAKRITVGIVKKRYIYANQPRVRLIWKAQGDGSAGETIVSPYTGVWLRDGDPTFAENLKQGSSVLHIRRSVDKFHGRVRLYSSTVGDNPKDQLEEQVLKLRWFKAPSDWQLHHEGFQPDENDIHWDKKSLQYVTNLVPLSNSDHQRQHLNENLSAAEAGEVKLHAAILGAEYDPDSSENHRIEEIIVMGDVGHMCDFDIEDVDPVEGMPTPSNYIADEICVMSEKRYGTR